MNHDGPVGHPVERDNCLEVPIRGGLAILRLRFIGGYLLPCIGLDGLLDSVVALFIGHGKPGDEQETVVPVVDQGKILLGDRGRVSHVDEHLASQAAHTFGHLGNQSVVDGLVGRISIHDLGVDWDAVVHAQQIVRQLLEIRSMVTTETLGDYKRLSVILHTAGNPRRPCGW